LTCSSLYPFGAEVPKTLLSSERIGIPFRIYPKIIGVPPQVRGSKPQPIGLPIGEFHNWLASQGKTKATIKETVNYAKRFSRILEDGDASELLTLSPRNKQHAMTALANLAKFQGRYDVFLWIRQRYSLKWSKGDSMQSFARFFNESLDFDTMLLRIKEMMRLLSPFMSKIIRFACLIGLRASEVVESVRLINSADEFPKYYNCSRSALEHFRFNQFQRQTKKCYISFVTPEMLSIVEKLDNVPTYNQVRLACSKAGIKCDLRFARKIFASWLHQCGISDIMIDLLQGRVGKSVLVNHYITPSQDYKAKVLQALEKLQK
jgi:intergrase/recombinase